jgi:hypothetical protein
MSASDSIAVAAVFGALKKNLGWLLALGIVSIVQGDDGRPVLPPWATGWDR